VNVNVLLDCVKSSSLPFPVTVTDVKLEEVDAFTLVTRVPTVTKVATREPNGILKGNKSYENAETKETWQRYQ
jgi:hypothetical protein